MLILKLIRSVYSGVGSIINSIYHWVTGDLGSNPGVGNVNTDDNANPGMYVQPNIPPVPPPLVGLQLLADMQFPFLRANRPSLRDLLGPLAATLAEPPATPQPQLRKRWRRERQAENKQAIEKALKQFKTEEHATKQDSQDSLGEITCKDIITEIYI